MTKASETIDMARNFTRYPGGRYKSDGPYSGQLFREKFLIPALRKKRSITINLDSALGYGSSFLEEAFGGAIREGFDARSAKALINLVSDDESLIAEIWGYVQDADSIG